MLHNTITSLRVAGVCVTLIVARTHGDDARHAHSLTVAEITCATEVGFVDTRCAVVRRRVVDTNTSRFSTSVQCALVVVLTRN